MLVAVFLNLHSRATKHTLIDTHLRELVEREMKEMRTVPISVEWRSSESSLRRAYLTDSAAFRRTKSKYCKSIVAWLCREIVSGQGFSEAKTIIKLSLVDSHGQPVHIPKCGLWTTCSHLPRKENQLTQKCKAQHNKWRWSGDLLWNNAETFSWSHLIYWRNPCANVAQPTIMYNCPGIGVPFKLIVCHI